MIRLPGVLAPCVPHVFFRECCRNGLVRKYLPSNLLARDNETDQAGLRAILGASFRSLITKCLSEWSYVPERDERHDFESENPSSGTAVTYLFSITDRNS